MTLSHVNDMLDRIEDVRTLFALGQRSLPFLEEVFHFLKEISPLLDEINASIQETTHKMPRATTQLQSATRATEVATTEILDLVDAVRERAVDVRTSAEQGSRLDKALADSDERILQLLRTSLQERDSVLLADVEQLFHRKATIRQKRAALYQPVFDGLDDIRNRVNEITLSLQVQDITSQQIAAASHLIESIRGRMTLLISRLGAEEEPVARLQGPIDPPAVFDPGARYDHAEDHQSVADEVFGQAGIAHHPVPPPSYSSFESLQPGGDGLGTPDEAHFTRVPHLRDIYRNGGKASQGEIDRFFEDGA